MGQEQSRSPQEYPPQEHYAQEYSTLEYSPLEYSPLEYSPREYFPREYSPQEYSPPSPESDDFILGLVLEASRHTARTVPACRFYAKGHCNRGDDCTFRHDKETYAPEILQSFKDSSKPPCRYYIKGSCNKGASCPFRHDDTFKSNGEEGSARRAAPCRFFSKGKCTKGDSCPFQHDSATKGQDLPQTTKVEYISPASNLLD